MPCLPNVLRVYDKVKLCPPHRSPFTAAQRPVHRDAMEANFAEAASLWVLESGIRWGTRYMTAVHLARSSGKQEDLWSGRTVLTLGVAQTHAWGLI